MNPLTNIRNTQELNKRELELGLIGKKSWHDKYKDSAWVFLGGLPYDLTEGDVICVFSQYGEVVNVNLVRDKQSGKFKGFGFLCYEDQRSTVLAVDNLNGFNILNRTIRVDHVEGYRQPKEHGDEDDVTQKLRAEGCAPKVEEEEEEDDEEDEFVVPVKKEKKEKHKKSKKKKEKKKKKKKDKSAKSDSSDSEEESTDDDKKDVQVKTEKVDRGYDKAINNSGWNRGERDGAPSGGSRPNKHKTGDRFNERLGEKGPRDRERKYDDERGGRDRKTEERTNERGRGQDRDEWGQGRDRYDEREKGRDDRKRYRTDDRQTDNRKRYHEDRHRSNDRYRDSDGDYRRDR
ncbi:RNA-binding motif protein, X-linked 2-like [Pecten maximus]|uniref:RNA-binding motif protein, X-linked 2-like n=1 Tax=Pecten maximus TaxID=6579 RepID=UPI001458F7C7|nr:RNA-binding motif protein, X-linked 2-like [Pecten maximus]